jgi:hypothetical protein
MSRTSGDQPTRTAATLASVPGLLTFVQTAWFLWLVSGLMGVPEALVFHLPSSFWYPFFAGESFTDLTIFTDQFKAFGTPVFWQDRPFPFTYPAPAAIAFHLIFLLGGRHPVRFFAGLLLIALLLAALAAAWAFRRRGLALSSTVILILVTVLSSYPFIFLFDRANIELVNWIFVSLAIAAVWHERWNLAGALLGVAISLKLFPFILLGLFVSRRKFLAGAVSLGTAAVLTLGSLALLGPSVSLAWHQIASGLKFFQKSYVFRFTATEVPFDHSLFAIVKHVYAHHFIFGAAPLATAARVYTITAALLATGLYLIRIRKLPRINQIVILTSLSILLPPVSADYTLVHLYPAWMILVLFALRSSSGLLQSLILPACFVLMAVALCPETYLAIGQLHFAGSFKAVALLALIGLLLIYPLEEGAATHVLDAGELSRASPPTCL